MVDGTCKDLYRSTVPGIAVSGLLSLSMFDQTRTFSNKGYFGGESQKIFEK